MPGKERFRLRYAAGMRRSLSSFSLVAAAEGVPRGALGLGVLALLLGCSSPAADSPMQLEDLSMCREPDRGLSSGCTGFTQQISRGPLPASSVLDEVSGAAVSRKNRDVMWVHNDSGGKAEVYAVSIAAGVAPRLIATVVLTGAENYDWEDLALGPSPRAAGDFLYIGDIGDNITSAQRRSAVQLYRIPEPSLDLSKSDQQLVLDGTQVERFELRYPGGNPSDSEALFVEPSSGEVFLITKNLSGPSLLYSAGVLAAPPPAPIELRPTLGCDGLPRLLSFAGGSPIVTGASFAAASRAVLVRAYSGTYLWQLGPSESVVDALARTACELPSADEKQGEAIAAAPDGKGYFTVSEGKSENIHVFASP